MSEFLALSVLMLIALVLGVAAFCALVAERSAEPAPAQRRAAQQRRR